MRTQHGMDLDAALSMRDAGEHDYREVARSGNMDPKLAPRPVGQGMFGLGAIDQQSLITVGIGLAVGLLIWRRLR